jgi:hypothetical protein
VSCSSSETSSTTKGSTRPAGDYVVGSLCELAATMVRDVAAAERGSLSTSPAPAALAGVRLARASCLLGGFALVNSVFVLVRLAEAWRVTPGAASHHISILGARLTYPAANAGAIVMLVLAGLGLMATGLALAGAVHEALASRRFARRLASQALGNVRDAVLIDDRHPRAFCAGLMRPRIYISTGALARLDDGPSRPFLITSASTPAGATRCAFASPASWVVRCSCCPASGN